MKFICEEHGVVEPKTIGYSCPLTGWCPVCHRVLEDEDGGIKVMTEDEAKAHRPEFYEDEEVQQEVDLPMRKYAILMDNGRSRWEGEARFSLEALTKAEAETGLRGAYFVEPTPISKE